MRFEPLPMHGKHHSSLPKAGETCKHLLTLVLGRQVPHILRLKRAAASKVNEIIQPTKGRARPKGSPHLGGRVMGGLGRGDLLHLGPVEACALGADKQGMQAHVCPRYCRNKRSQGHKEGGTREAKNGMPPNLGQNEASIREAREEVDG